ncbi:MAG: thymidylate synthase [Anaerolineaceae bacterium]
MKQYQDLIEMILENGIPSDDRTGVGTYSIFGYQMRFNLQDGFPATTTKKLAFRSVVSELLWFLRGDTDERNLASLLYDLPKFELLDKKTIWTANANEQGRKLGYRNDDEVKELGPIYGAQWRGNGSSWHVDQMMELIENIQTKPDSRRLIISAWNPENIKYMALPPCHCFAQFRVYDGKLSCLMYQRSADSALGIPFNIASYALLTHLIARECGLEVGEFVHSIGDAHIYKNHIEGCRTFVEREPLTLPDLVIDRDFNLMDFLNLPLGVPYEKGLVNKFRLENYKYHAPIHFDMAV